MDNLTHSLFGATLARTPLGRAGRSATVAPAAGVERADIDFVASAGGAAEYLEWHRGVTHGPLGLVGLSVAAAAIVAVGRRLNPKWRHADDAPSPDAGRRLHDRGALPPAHGSPRRHAASGC